MVTGVATPEKPVALSGAGSLDFVAGGGEVGAHIRARDWAETSLGPIRNWPAELRMAIRLMLTSNHPMLLFWGQDGATLYNDAFAASIGPERHPHSLGRPAHEVWAETWDVTGPQIELVMAGKGSTWHEDQLVPITRHGERQDVYWTYSYGPVNDPRSPTGVGGALCVVQETTKRVMAERALERSIEAKEVLLREVNHRIKNSLQLATSLLSMEGRSAHTEETRSSLARASARIGAIASVHELIYRSDTIETVPIDGYLGDLCDAIVASALDGSDRVTMDCDADALELRTDLAIGLALLVNELATNALKHAFPDGREGRIDIELRDRGSHLYLCVSDDGVGKREDAGANQGSRIIAGLVAQHGGTMREACAEPGLTVEIDIPKGE